MVDQPGTDGALRLSGGRDRRVHALRRRIHAGPEAPEAETSTITIK
jgi:hypothetical protein